MTQETITLEMLAKRVQELELRLQGINAVHESFAKLGAHAATCEPSAVKSEMQALKADMLDIANKVESMRDALATGHNMQPKITFSKEDLIEAMPEKIEQASLREVFEATS